MRTQQEFCNDERQYLVDLLKEFPNLEFTSSEVDPNSTANRHCVLSTIQNRILTIEISHKHLDDVTRRFMHDSIAQFAAGDSIDCAAC